MFKTDLSAFMDLFVSISKIKRSSCSRVRPRIRILVLLITKVIATIFSMLLSTGHLAGLVGLADQVLTEARAAQSRPKVSTPKVHSSPTEGGGERTRNGLYGEQDPFPLSVGIHVLLLREVVCRKSERDRWIKGTVYLLASVHADLPS